MKRPKPLALIILDGWGVADADETNAIRAASTPNFDEWLKRYPNTLLESAGEAVGLPEGQMGNSEVGHLNIGAGRIVPQELTRISSTIEDKTFFNNPTLIQAFENSAKQNTKVHFMGLLSDGGVHSHIKHLFALLEFARQKNVSPVLHLFLDGRDVPPKSAMTYIDQLETKIAQLGIGQIATISGRYYAMDRDNRWERVEKAYNAMTLGKGEIANSAKEALNLAYMRGETDEFVKPTIVEGKGSGVEGRKSLEAPNDLSIKENDSVIFFNFRPDRSREITRAYIDPDFNNFDRGAHPSHVFFASLTQYDETFDIPVFFSPMRPKKILADVLAENNLKQLRIAETEKYAHVTFFFNGGEETKKPFEERILIPSPKVATYDLKPEMSANEVTEEVIKQVTTDVFDVIILNFANADMVGHTGIFEAAKEAIEVLDRDLKKIVDKILQTDGAVLITADHGNSEKMADLSTDKPHTAHTTSRVPFLMISNNEKVDLRTDGILADIAPTMLDILGIDKPSLMTGESLIKD